MEPMHSIPIKAFPNNAAMIEVAIKQTQNRVINTFLIEFQRRVLFRFDFRTPMHGRGGADQIRLRRLPRSRAASAERRGLGRKRNVCDHFPRNLGADGAERNFVFGHGFEAIGPLTLAFSNLVTRLASVHSEYDPV